MQANKTISKLNDIVNASTNEATLKLFRKFLLDTGECEKDSLHIYTDNNLFIKKDDFPIINQGTRQVLADIGEGYLIKTRIRYPEFDYYVIDNEHYIPDIIQSEKNLKAFGFNVPKNYFITAKDGILSSSTNPNSIYFLVTEDLTEKGKYDLVEYSKEAAESAINAKHGFAQSCENAIEFLVGLYHLESHVDKINELIGDYRHKVYSFDEQSKRNFSYVEVSHRLILNGHIKEEKKAGPEVAVRHMFFIQFGEYRFGTLYAGDLDHAFLINR